MSDDVRSRRRKIGDWLIYLLLRTIAATVWIAPWFMSRLAARFLAWFCYTIDRRHREVALDNLRQSFPEWDERERVRVCRASYRHFVQMLFEMIRLPKVVNERNVKEHFFWAAPENEDQFQEIRDSGRPILALTGHFGNWEVFSYMGGMMGYTAKVVARRLDNPHVDRYLERLRSNTGQVMLDKRHDYNKILECLEANEMLGMLADQDAGNRGLFVDFLGRPASTFESIAVLALKYSAPIVVFGATRVAEPIYYQLYLEDIIDPEEYKHQRDGVFAITQRYSDAVARLARRHPEQYFWFHRRWKTPPRKKKAQRAAA